MTFSYSDSQWVGYLLLLLWLSVVVYFYYKRRVRCWLHNSVVSTLAACAIVYINSGFDIFVFVQNVKTRYWGVLLFLLVYAIATSGNPEGRLTRSCMSYTMTYVVVFFIFILMSRAVI